MAKCNVTTCSKDAISETIKQCFTHFARAYPTDNKPAKFSTLSSSDKTAVGKELFALLDRGQAPFQNALYHDATVSWGMELDTVAKTNVFGTCVALCIGPPKAADDDDWIPRDLLVGINDLNTFDDEQLAKVLAGANKILRDYTSYIKRIIFLNGTATPYACSSGLTRAPALAVACDNRATIHAEMRVLEFLHLAKCTAANVAPSVGNAAQTAKVAFYIGISKACCAKCEAIIQAYNQWANGWFTIERQGCHGEVHHQWSAPKGLKAVTTTIPYWKTLKHALQT